MLLARARLDDSLDHGGRDGKTAQHNRASRLAQCIAGADGFEAHHRDDVAGHGFANLGVRVRMHPQQPANTLDLAGCRIDHRGSRRDPAGIDPDERQRSKPARMHLGHQGDKRLVGARQALLRLTSAWIGARDRRPIARCRGVVNDRVEQRLDTHIPIIRTAEHGG